tara:strand:- start:143 stop:310 length:168 start_codon:yes stop_codon:yes gene_type:complete
MTKQTDQELQAELQEVVKKHNDAIEIQNQCKTRFTQIQAILKDRQGESKEDPTIN